MVIKITKFASILERRKLFLSFSLFYLLFLVSRNIGYMVTILAPNNL